MEWNKKVEMVTLHNNDDQEGFLKFLKENVSEIINDAQATDMFLTCITITDEEVQQNREIYKQFTLSDEIKSNLSMRAQLRYEYLHLIMNK